MRLLFAVFFFTRLVSRMLKRTHPYPLLLHIFVGVAVVPPPPTIYIFTPLLCAACTYAHSKTRLLYPVSRKHSLRHFFSFFRVFSTTRSYFFAFSKCLPRFFLTAAASSSPLSSWGALFGIHDVIRLIFAEFCIWLASRTRKRTRPYNRLYIFLSLIHI